MADEVRVDGPTETNGIRIQPERDKLECKVTIHGPYGEYDCKLLQKQFGQDANGDLIVTGYMQIAQTVWTGNPQGDSNPVSTGQEISLSGEVWGEGKFQEDGLYKFLEVRVNYTELSPPFETGPKQVETNVFSIQVPLEEETEDPTGPPIIQ